MGSNRASTDAEPNWLGSLQVQTRGVPDESTFGQLCPAAAAMIVVTQSEQTFPEAEACAWKSFDVV